MAIILIAEDEKPINELIKRNLNLVGHTAIQVYDGYDAVSETQKRDVDLILLDVMLPGLSGFEVKEQISTDIPVIFVTAKTGLNSRLKGLGLGADDYLEKPFEILELLARIEAVLRRTHKQQSSFELDGCSVNLGMRRVHVFGKEVFLTPQEFELLDVLIKNRNLALSRDKLLELAWGYDYEGDSRTVDVHIQKLRKKLGWEKQLQTVYKLGYRLTTI